MIHRRFCPGPIDGLMLAALCAPLLCGPALAQPPTPAAPADMAMPDDLGAPLDDAAAPAPAEHALSIASPIAVVAANPQGRAVLDRDLPGLCERPEFMMFKGMSLAKLASLSHGRLTSADLQRVQADLSRLQVAQASRPHSLLTRGGQAVGRVSKAVYLRVRLMIAAL